MSSPWSALSDTRALPPGDERHVPRPWGGGDRLGVLIKSGLSPIAVTGPSGSGKSTELARAAHAIESDSIALVLRVDTLVSLLAPSPELVLYVIAEAMLDQVVAERPDVVPSKQLVADIRASDPRLSRGTGAKRDPAELIGLVADEIRRLFDAPAIALMLDGLDHAPVPIARAAVQGLLDVKDRVPVVVVVDPELANGPTSRDLLQRYRVYGVPAVPVREGTPGADRGRAWLRDVARARVGDAWTDTVEPVIARAADRSGGLVRTFAELVADAASFATIAGGTEPSMDGLAEAIRDRTDNLRRLLREGDLDALADAAGTDGLDVEVERRVRFLSQGLMLEVPSGESTIVLPHPMLEAAIAARPGSRRAPIIRWRRR